MTTIFADRIYKNPIKTLTAFNSESLKSVLNAAETARKQYIVIGYVRYEATEAFAGKAITSKLPLAHFEIFKNSGEPLPSAKTHPAICKIQKLSQKNYVQKIHKIKEYIQAGETYQVNFTCDHQVVTNGTSEDLFYTLREKQPTPYSFFMQNEFEEILGFSPELFFEIQDGIIRTRPMKGTAPRGKTPEEDTRQKIFLQNDRKNRAENLMIVDLLRNDLGRICSKVTAKNLFEIETYPTLFQMISEIKGKLCEDISLYEIFQALFPCGSITGAPKIRTMEIIQELENEPRGVYCGATLLMTPEKITTSVPIRILEHIQKHSDTNKKLSDEAFFHYHVGGAITWLSNPKEEWEEIQTKTKFLDAKPLQLLRTSLNITGADFGNQQNSFISNTRQKSKKRLLKKTVESESF